MLLNLWVLIAYNIFAGLQSLLIGKPVIEQDVPAGSKSSTTMRYSELIVECIQIIIRQMWHYSKILFVCIYVYIIYVHKNSIVGLKLNCIAACALHSTAGEMI